MRFCIANDLTPERWSATPNDDKWFGRSKLKEHGEFERHDRRKRPCSFNRCDKLK